MGSSHQSFLTSTQSKLQELRACPPGIELWLFAQALQLAAKPQLNGHVWALVIKVSVLQPSLSCKNFKACPPGIELRLFGKALQLATKPQLNGHVCASYHWLMWKTWKWLTCTQFVVDNLYDYIYIHMHAYFWIAYGIYWELKVLELDLKISYGSDIILFQIRYLVLQQCPEY